MNPDDGKTLEHFFLVVVESVPFPYGAPVETGIGTTVAVLRTTTAAPEVETAATWLSPAAEPRAPELALAATGLAVSV
jgi:hypothetical protein